MSKTFVTSTGSVQVIESSTGAATIIKTSPDSAAAQTLGMIGSVDGPATPIVASTALTASSPEFIPVDTTSGGVTITLPYTLASTLGTRSKRFVIKKVSSDANVVTVSRSGAPDQVETATLGTYANTMTFSGAGESHTFVGYSPSSQWMRTS